MSNLQNISLRQIKIFKAIVDTGNLSRAAEQIGLTTPAVSTALKSLEDHLETLTMRRDKSGSIELLPVGREVYKLALRLEAAINLTQTRMDAMQQGYEGFVKIGVVSTAKYFAPAIIKAANLHLPKIKIDLMIGNRAEIIEALDTQDIHLAIMGRPPRQPVVNYAPIGKHPHIFLAAPEFEWDGDWQSLEGVDFLVREEQSGTRILFERFIASSPLSNLTRKIFYSNESIKQATMANLGVAFLSASTSQYELTAGRLKILKLPELPIVREWYLVWNAAEALDAASEHIYEFVVSNRETLMPSPSLDF